MSLARRLKNIRSGHSGLVFWYTALVVLISLWFSAYTWFSLHQRLYGELQETLTRRLEQIRGDILPQTARRPAALATELRTVYAPESTNRFIRITRESGEIVYVSGAPKDHAFDPQSVPAAADGDLPARVVPALQGSLYISALRATGPGGAYVVEMGASTAEIEDTLRKLVITELIGLPFVAALAVFGGLVLVRQALRPVEEIRATAEQITFGGHEMKARVPVPATGDALEHLSVTLNRMLDRLDGAYEQASRFSADAAHELRTPLTILRSELETLEALGREKNVPPEWRKHIGSVQEEAERLSSIVGSLLTIARLDGGEAKMENQPVDLAALLRSTLEQMQLLAEKKRLAVTLEARAPVFVTGDAFRLKQFIVNLLDNAIKYTMPGGAVSFSVRAAAGKALFEVSDNGIGIAAEALPHVFERFYRADRARARQGAGLGLSIVRAICQAHGGTIGIDSTEGGGTSVRVELPLAKA